MDRQTGGGVDPTTGLFVQGNPQQGTIGSGPLASWGNAVGEELRNLVLASEQTPDFENWTQVVRAVAILSARNATMPNLLVNGGMEFWQRGFANVLAAQDKYTADRWSASPGSGAAAVLRITPNSAGGPARGDAQFDARPPNLGCCFRAAQGIAAGGGHHPTSWPHDHPFLVPAPGDGVCC